VTPDWQPLSDYLTSPSCIRDCGAACCRLARGWLRSLDRSYSYERGVWLPPVWFRGMYRWGPMAWPVRWCDLPMAEVLDCGALAALGTDLFRSRGEQSLSVQLILSYPANTAAGWTALWEGAGNQADWIRGRYCYHEACGVVRSGRLAVWDPTEGRWLEPGVSADSAVGGVMAIRYSDGTDPSLDRLSWGEWQLNTGEWMRFDRAAMH
jgi:hypothetical protein